MISENFAKEQLARIKDLPFAPVSVDGLRELRNALMMAENEGMARAVVQTVLDDFTHCPTPAEIRGLMQQKIERDRPGGWQPSESTCVCGGTGFVIVQIKPGYTGAKRCSCRGGAA